MNGRPEEDSRTKNWSVFIVVVVSFYFFSDLLLLFLRLESYFVAQADLNLPALLPALAPKL